MYCATITACQRVSRWEPALTLLMEASQFRSTVVHNATMSVFEKATQWELALHVWTHQPGSPWKGRIS
eukprot:symbB.v1.2.017110.t1/scaffold1276.1/size127259/1